MNVKSNDRIESLRRLAANLIVHSEFSNGEQDEWLSLVQGMILPDFERLAVVLEESTELDEELWQSFLEQISDARADFERRRDETFPRPLTARELLQQMLDDSGGDCAGP